jgi:hypothetical protein
VLARKGRAEGVAKLLREVRVGSHSAARLVLYTALSHPVSAQNAATNWLSSVTLKPLCDFMNDIGSSRSIAGCPSTQPPLKMTPLRSATTANPGAHLFALTPNAESEIGLQDRLVKLLVDGLTALPRAAGGEHPLSVLRPLLAIVRKLPEGAKMLLKNAERMFCTGGPSLELYKQWKEDSKGDSAGWRRTAAARQKACRDALKLRKMDCICDAVAVLMEEGESAVLKVEVEAAIAQVKAAEGVMRRRNTSGYMATLQFLAAVGKAVEHVSPRHTQTLLGLIGPWLLKEIDRFKVFGCPQVRVCGHRGGNILTCVAGVATVGPLAFHTGVQADLRALQELCDPAHC